LDTNVKRWRKTVGDAVAVGRLLAKEPALTAQFEGVTPTMRRKLNLALLKWEWYRCASTLSSYPARLCIEASSACNLGCPHCFTGAGEVSRPRAMLSLEFYRRLLAEFGDRLCQIEFHNWGEPMLNKHLFTMIAEASALGISTDFCTNFSVPFDDARAEQLVRSGLKMLGVSIDGARQDVYEQYRVRGQLDLVLRNCRLVTEAKQRLGSPTPRMNWVYHVFSHNRGDVELARAMARELDMHFDAARGRVVGPDWDPEARWIAHDHVEPIPCFTLWHTAVVFGDGSMAPCRGSFYAHDDMGRIATDGRPGVSTFREGWNSQRFRLARRFFREERAGTPEEQRHICFNCPYTIDWHHYLGHVMLGGARDTWKAAFNSNERYNYFWSRRQEAVTAADVPLTDAQHRRAHGAAQAAVPGPARRGMT
jgi:hypothetical protein